MTEDFLAVVQAKRFLGREFLTWVVHRVEEGGGRMEHDGAIIELTLGDRVVLAGTGQDGAAHRGRRGRPAPRDRRRAAARQAARPLDQAKLAITRGERRWELSLDGGFLTYDGLRYAPLGDRDRNPKEDPRAALENDLFLRVADMESAIDVLDRLFAEFCRVRGSSTWSHETLPTLRAWVDGLR